MKQFDAHADLWKWKERPRNRTRGDGVKGKGKEHDFCLQLLGGLGARGVRGERRVLVTGGRENQKNRFQEGG